jgi:hypothetical protein
MRPFGISNLFLVAAIFPLTLASLCPAYAGEVTGTLRDATGKPLADTAIALQDGQGGIVAKTASDANGAYDFHAVANGSYVLMATQGDTVLTSAPLSVTGDAPQGKDHDDPARSGDECRDRAASATGAQRFVSEDGN